MLSESVENYLKAIYELQQEASPVATSAIAARMNVSAASASAMVKKLASERPKLLEHVRHRGVKLSRTGERVALEVIRHHRLIEMYLHQALGYSWDEVHEEAEKLEHAISEQFEDRIAEMLGHPSFDPHGDPIPSKDGRMPAMDFVCLADVEAGRRAFVRRVRSDDPEMLRYLAEIGIIPDASLRVEKRAPFDGPVHIKLVADAARTSHVLGRRVSECVFVELA